MNEYVGQYEKALLAQKGIYDRAFLPVPKVADGEKVDPFAIKPFPEQEAFLRDVSLTKLARCGNRAAKTFTTMRELSWMLTRKHWYNPRWKSNNYMENGNKIFWCVVPDFEFAKTVIWEQTLKHLIAEWYYTDPVTLTPMIEAPKMAASKDAVAAIRFRNGDRLEFKTYSQNLRALMGRAVHGVFVDEMPADSQILVELVARCLDWDSPFIMGFTPVVASEEVRSYVDNHASLALHSWSVLDNPHYRDNPVRRARLLAEFANLSVGERDMRIKGDWHYVALGIRVFENVTPVIVPDETVLCRITPDWRQVRVCDPATHRSGFAIFAEDPETNCWYCIEAREIEWRGALAKAEQIEAECDKLATWPEMKYNLSIFDNAESWFGIYVKNTLGRWTACVKKEKEQLIMLTRDAIVTGKIKFLKYRAAPLVKQIYMYQRKEDGSIRKIKDHMVDCLQYFCRQMPNPVQTCMREVDVDSHASIIQHHFAKLANKNDDRKETRVSERTKTISARRVR